MEKEVNDTKTVALESNLLGESKTNKGMKINISLTSAKIIEAKVLELRQMHCAVSPSKLVDAILDIFIEKYFDKESERLKHYLFDEKRFVRSLLKQSLTTEEFEKALKDMKRKTANLKSVKGDAV